MLIQTRVRSFLFVKTLFRKGVNFSHSENTLSMGFFFATDTCAPQAMMQQTQNISHDINGELKWKVAGQAGSNTRIIIHCVE